eukprot:NODE_7239_length_1597_cov_2.930612.p1 GENE.NODE_7239_length_1597_cov_2.930612~~NODE_7239_length_1597_cov_2.930612.p1  ORF type:complete len:490 (+),score=201.25 NODE_7239_length_1597_cov_2.930612:167-1471(+)
MLHAVSGAVVRGRAPGAGTGLPLKEASTEGDATFWLTWLSEDTDAAKRSRDILAGYAFHTVAAALRSDAITSDAAKLSQALELFLLWFEDSAPACLRELPDNSEEVVPGRCWVWIILQSPFPAELVSLQPAAVLRCWKAVCGTLSAARADAAEGQILCLTRVILRLDAVLKASLACAAAAAEPVQPASAVEEGEQAAPAVADFAAVEREERAAACVLAALVPAAVALCGVMQRVAEDKQPGELRDAVKSAARASLTALEGAFSAALGHASVRVAQAGTSSAQSLLQHSSAAALCAGIAPSLLLLLASPPSEQAAVSAWGALSVMVTAQPPQLVEATTPMVLQLVLNFARCGSQNPGGSAAHQAMAQCLVQVGQADQRGLKACVAAMPPEDQGTVQQLLRNHVAAGHRDSQEAQGTRGGAPASLAATKIELKMKF